jgi:superfamily II DNA or RNA helicase
MAMNKSQREALRSILRGSRTGNSELASLQDLFAHNFYEAEFRPKVIDDWIDSVEEVVSMFPAAMRVSNKAEQKISVDAVYEQGQIEGTWKAGGQSHRVYIALDHEPAPAGCNCTESEGVNPCQHSFSFAFRVLGKLKQDQSLRRRIRQGRFAAGEPNWQNYLPNQSDIALGLLDQLIDQSQSTTNATDAPEDTLPAAETAATKRIVWNINLDDDGDYTIDALLQQKRKRGNGFTKGKKLSLQKLVHDRSLPLGPADVEVVQCISQPSSYYYSSNFSLDVFDAVEKLIGQTNVLCDHEPVSVLKQPPLLMVKHTPDRGYHITFIRDDEAGGIQFVKRMLAASDAVMQIDTDRNRIYFWREAPERFELLTSLVQFPPVDQAHADAFLEKLSTLQTRLSLVLPEEYGGKLEFRDAPLAVLLRSRSDGKLDFGIRVRDHQGVLRRPLRGPLVSTIERDGKKVQLARSPQREARRVTELLDRWKLSLDREEWFGTIDDFAEGLRLLENLQSPDSDVEVLWDKSGEQPTTILGSLGSNNVRVEITNKRNWFGINGECNFGEHKMSLADLIQRLPDDQEGNIGEYIKLGDGQWAKISEGLRKRLKKLQEATHTDRKTLKLDATAAPAVRDLMDDVADVKASRAWEKCLKRLANAETLDPEVPAALDANLRDYQVDGFKWMRRLAEWGVGGILADDMGLGKTLQTLAVLLDRSHEGPALVIAPTSVGFNWVREAERFAPDLDVHLYRETERADFLPNVGAGTLVVCSYGLALRDAEALATVDWSTLVLDEAQAIKNSRSKTSKAIARIEADWTVALTGTPVENHLGELWSLFHVVSPGVFGGWDHFRKRYAAPIEKEQNQDVRKLLADRLKPFVLRRTKTEVLTELPPRTEMNLSVDLSPAERAEYEKIRRAAVDEIAAIETLPHIQDQRFKILALLTRLRQIACHAGLVNKQWTGSSAKLDQLCETLESLREEGHKALVFSQFTEYLALIRKALDERGIRYEYLDGSTPAKARQAAVDQFQSGSAEAFLISLKAGGTGLNLTAADYVIHMDPWWNPAVEDQATDRAHRMGQEKPVMVYRIVARGTIEEEILALHESKRDLVEGVMQGTEAAGKLSNDDLIRMLKA